MATRQPYTSPEGGAPATRRAAEPAAPGPAPMSPPLRILLCDHRGNGLAELSSFLGERGFELAHSTSLRHSLEALRAQSPSAIVLETLSGEGTVELRAIDAARAGSPPVPLLVVVPPGDHDAIVRADRSLEGALWDVVESTATRDEVRLRLERLVAQASLQREMSELRHRASHDDRTDLLRPAAFQARLSEHFSAAQRHKLDLALVLMDLDRFGAINKRYDHTVGDRIISQVGEVIRGALRTEDVAGRLGGDEFAVVLPYTRKIAAAQVVNRLREEIAALSFRPEGSDVDLHVSTSIGFETFDGRDVDSLQTLRRRAEIALRAAKRQGGDRGVYYRSLAETEGTPARTE